MYRLTLSHGSIFLALNKSTSSEGTFLIPKGEARIRFPKGAGVRLPADRSAEFLLSSAGGYAVVSTVAPQAKKEEA